MPLQTSNSETFTEKALILFSGARKPGGADQKLGGGAGLPLPPPGYAPGDCSNLFCMIIFAHLEDELHV